MPVNYQNGKVYKIYSLSNPDLVYVGSTTQSLSKRLAEHRMKYKQWKRDRHGSNITSYRIFEETDNYRIQLIEFCPCNSREELHRAEGKYIIKMDCINKKVAGRTRREHYQDNKEQRKQYLYANREKIAQQRKEYRQTNRQAIAHQAKQYYEQNKHTLAQKVKVKITCECGSVVSKHVIARHRRSQKHQRLMNQQ